MRLAVVTVNYCCAAEILRGLDVTAAQIAEAGGEWWIVDNHSPDDSAQVLREAIAKRRGIHLIEAPRNGGFGYGNNQVINRVLSGEIAANYIYFLNPDAVPEPGAVEALASYLDMHRDVGAVGSGLIDEHGASTDSMFRFPSFWSEVEWATCFGPVSRLLRQYRVSRPLDSAGPADWVSGASLMVRVDVLRAVGGFDEDFFLYFEEVELCHRAWNAGFAVHGLPQAKVRHVGGVSTGMREPSPRLSSHWHRSRNFYFAKTRTGGSLPLLNLATAVALGARRSLEFVRGKPWSNPHLLRDHIRHALSFRRQSHRSRSA